MDGLNYFGVETVGGVFDSILQAGAGVAQGAIAAKERQDAEEKTSASEKSKLDTAIAADVNASNAAARAEVSAKLKSASAKVDAAAAARAAQAQDRAGADLSSDSQKARIAAADQQLDAATSRAQVNPKDGYQAALVKAWTVTANKAHGGSMAAGEAGAKGKGKKSGDSESWWTRRVVGPIPGVGVVVGGVGILGGIGYAIKRIFFK